MPVISIQVLVFNSALYLPQCLQSLKDQTFKDFEVLLLDAGSTDGSPELCSAAQKGDSRFRHLRYEEKLSVGRARVEAFNHSSGTYIAVLDSDDWAHHRRLELQQAWLDRHPETVLLGSYYRVVTAHGFPIRLWPIHLQNDIEIRWRVTFGNCLTHSTIMYRRAAASAIGGYNSGLPTGEDIDFYGRMLSQGQFYVLDKPLVYYRTHGASLSNTEPPERKETFPSIVRNAIEQQVGVTVRQSVAAAVYNQSIRPADSLTVAQQSVDLLRNAYHHFKTHVAKTRLDHSLLGRTVFLHALQFMTKNDLLPWWPSVEPVWRELVHEVATKAAYYDWRRDPGLIFHTKALLKTSPRALFLALN